MTIRVPDDDHARAGSAHQRSVVPLLSDGLVTVRAFQESDAAGLVAVCRDEEVRRWTNVPDDYTLDMARRHIHQVVPGWWRDGTKQVWAVVATTETAAESGSPSKYLGSINLHAFAFGRAEIGLAFGAEARGTGAAERAVRLILDYAFDHLNLEYVAWRAITGNWGSRKLAWKCGFAFDGELRGAAEHRGELRNVWCLSLQRDEPRSPREPWVG
ncbi:GNAT family N-acetyltransferase [Arthrobacter sp. ISL-30]|uniref:GNAT family N-acetyltransferase n=1 Tax=Arthrobacter sp. ISL-30 TaxID=2819109 RepID=UPI001BEBDE97|nr:GNAT family N-acetyltransferase [Arthrobacter sp. ISL-30]MBT2514273.1 GNAT family N-acetyltransferase [Arthrobacter sp. ISL-30]